MKKPQMIEYKLVRVSILIVFFLIGFFLPEPNFIHQNFWSKAEFWNVLPFTPSYYLYRLLYATALTGLTELSIRFIKRYA
jgi:hypothetical protein